MTTPSFRANGSIIGAVSILALTTSCGGSTAAPAVQPSANQIAGGASCGAAEGQDLTFSGAIKGHLSCSTSPAKCATSHGIPSLLVPLDARLGSTAIQFLVDFEFWRVGLKHDQTGTFAAGRLGDEQDSSPYGATMDGSGHWETPTPGGSMTLSRDDDSGAAGAVDIKLANGNQTFAVVGSWRCVRP